MGDGNIFRYGRSPGLGPWSDGLDLSDYSVYTDNRLKENWDADSN